VALSLGREKKGGSFTRGKVLVTGNPSIWRGGGSWASLFIDQGFRSLKTKKGKTKKGGKESEGQSNWLEVELKGVGKTLALWIGGWVKKVECLSWGGTVWRKNIFEQVGQGGVLSGAGYMVSGKGG